MKLFGFILAASVALCALQVLVVALYLALLIAVVGAACFRPRETIGFLVVTCAAAVFNRYPIAVVCVICVLGVAAYVNETPFATVE